ncbi:MAG: murein DD-endopeptidase MepM/ murein hydrolase activator NlpD [Gammaproteobacteria bacterium]|jgi:murein DD-endopeptidase MepM/ murein hydrolase activator NlpD
MLYTHLNKNSLNNTHLNQQLTSVFLMSLQNLDLKMESGRLSRKRDSFSTTFKLPYKRALKVLIASLAIVLLGFSASNWQPAAKVANSNLKSERLHYEVELPDTNEHASQLPTDYIKQKTTSIDQWVTVTIKSGDTLASIFSKKGISARTTHEIANLNEQTKTLRTIRPGQTIDLLVDSNQNLRKMKYSPDITKTLEIHRKEDQSFGSQLVNFHLDAFPVFREGVISSSLFEAAAEAKIPERVIMDMASIFGWDIDFALDIRKGDRFSLVYNELYKEDVKIRSGRILAAEFINNGKTYRAIYYIDPDGNGDYFTETGKSMRKAFLRSPVEFTRISSRFSNKRWHPILSKWRSHKGVDYAAARGTPIRASGDGKITFAGNKGGYGRVVIIQHGGRYTTVYGHLNKFARGARSGKKVKQGQIIGYVGSSGLATGPHLHYEFRVNGVHRNPLTVKLPEAKPVLPSFVKHFKDQSKVYLSMLTLMNNTVATNTQ